MRGYSGWVSPRGRKGRFRAQCGSMPRKLAAALPVTPRHPHTMESKPHALRVPARFFWYYRPSTNLYRACDIIHRLDHRDTSRSGAI